MAKTPGNVNARRLPNWITSFMRLTENTESPVVFRKWAGISILGSVMERKVWSQTRLGILYPNLYVVLVGSPGSGKSVIVSLCERILRGVEELHIAPSSVTSASLVDTLQLAVRKVLYPQFFQFNSLQVLSSELQNFLPSYEASFMGILTKLYDCELYEERRRTGKVNHIRIDHTQLSILAGTTPSFLNTLLPEGAWDQGFTSRTIFVFGGGRKSDIDWFDNEADTQYSKDLLTDVVHDLKEVTRLLGQTVWAQSAKDSLVSWARAGEKPVPEHGRLTHYNTRRIQHLIKLSTIASIARGSDMQVYPEDFDTALAWLLEAEALMPEIFKSMSMTPEARSMEDARYYVKQVYTKMGGPVPEYFLISFLKDRIPSQNLSKVIEIMVRSKMLKVEFNSNGVAQYTPLGGIIRD